MSTDVVEAVVQIHGGVKFYRGAARAARAYVELDRSRADDYYLGEGSGVANRLVAGSDGPVKTAGPMAGDTYEQWVAGIDVDTGQPKGRLRKNANGLRFVEVVVNGPKTWSLAAALHPEISAALDAAQDEAAAEIVGWVASHATTRIGPRGRQVQVPVERIEAAVIRHHTSRAGDPHRHLHLQINARVCAAGVWRGIHSVGLRDSIEALNGIGHAAVATNPRFLAAMAQYGFTLDSETSEVVQLAPYAGAFSARTAQIRRNVDRYEAAWRREHPDEEPGPWLREAWDRRAWSEARPDKVVPADGSDLVNRWNQELRDLGYTDPRESTSVPGIRAGQIDRALAAELVVAMVGAKKSAWNVADVRGRAEVLLSQTGLVADPAIRIDVAEDITSRAVARCMPLLARPDVPEHVRALTSREVLKCEAEIIARLVRRSQFPTRMSRSVGRGLVRIDPAQAAVVGVLAGDGQLVVVEGAAGAGKTRALRDTRTRLASQGHRLVVVTPTLKAAEVAAAETGADGHSAAWVAHQHGWRWTPDGRWSRLANATPSDEATLRLGDLLLIDEAGMLDQDTARALLSIADDAGARVALVGDRHQLPAVGRGGVLDHAVAWAHPTAVVALEGVHRFADPGYAQLSLDMRAGRDPEAVFDELHRRGEVVIHPSDVERIDALAEIGTRGDLVIADTRELVADLNAAIQERRDTPSDRMMVTAAGEQVSVGDRVATRRNDPDLQVANRQTWTVAGIHHDGGLVLHRQGRDRAIPATYANEHVELAYATTVHGAQGETVRRAHAVFGETTGAAAAYVAMTRGRESNVAHLVAESIEDARRQWCDAFARDRADLGPAHARRQAIEALDRYGPTAAKGSPRVSLATLERRASTELGL